MEAINKINLLPSTKAEKEQFIFKATQEILSGNYSVIDLYARIDLIKKTLDEIMKDNEVKQALETEISLYNEKIFEVGSFKFEKRSRKSLDYSVDMEYNKLKADLKAREQFLKTNKCNEDGEVIPQKQTDYIAITVK